jgi:hypothetical protein
MCGCGHVEPEFVGRVLGDGVLDRGRVGIGQSGHVLALGGRGLGLHASSCGDRTGRATRLDATEFLKDLVNNVWRGYCRVSASRRSAEHVVHDK